MQNEGPIGGVGCPCVGFVIRSAGLLAAVDGEPSSDESSRFLFDEDLTAQEHCVGLDLWAVDECEGFVCFKMFAELL